MKTSVSINWATAPTALTLPVQSFTHYTLYIIHYTTACFSEEASLCGGSFVEEGELHIYARPENMKYEKYEIRDLWIWALPSSLGVPQLYSDLQQRWENDPNAAKAPAQGSSRREDIRVKSPAWLQRFCWLYQQHSILKILGSFISWAWDGNAYMSVISSLQLYFTCFLSTQTRNSQSLTSTTWLCILVTPLI